MAVMASVIGFMGPFGTYSEDELAGRVSDWAMLLSGAYLLIRPAILGLSALSRAAALPEMTVVFWGVAMLSGPLAVLWRNVGGHEFRQLDGYSALIPFALLCALGVLAVVQWAQRADRRLGRRLEGGFGAEAAGPLPDDAEGESHGESSLRARLSPRFHGPILALQSEDHYVRVHGIEVSELLLMRLRDAIAEMDGVAGGQVHRSWWVARDGIAGCEPAGRSWSLILRNGAVAPVARDSVSRLRNEGILPASGAVQMAGAD